MRYYCRSFLFTILFLVQNRSSFAETDLHTNAVHSQARLPEGTWRGVIHRKDGHLIVFNFIVREKNRQPVIDIINGSERLLVDSIRVKGDSVFIKMPFFNSYFSLRMVNSHELQGNWIKDYGDHLVIQPFQAVKDITQRFSVDSPPRFNISGRWSVLFTGDRDSTISVGEFIQTGAQVTGTFLTTTGDYRFLQGVVSGDSLKLSTFDGGHAYSFESRITGNDTMNGFYYAGATSVESWVAKKNEEARLPDAFSLTHLKDSEARLHFRFTDLNGQMISLSDPRFRNKVVIVQILGSWCPNCMDETRFLAPWFLENKNRGIEIVGLAYERTASFASAKKLLQPFITRFHVTYPILATGVAVGDSMRTEKTLPEIQQIVGFPTTIFIDRKGLVRKIETGFNGPGTGQHYEEFKASFNELVSSLVTE